MPCKKDVTKMRVYLTTSLSSLSSHSLTLLTLPHSPHTPSLPSHSLTPLTLPHSLTPHQQHASNTCASSGCRLSQD